jgi:hypothetical protein
VLPERPECLVGDPRAGADALRARTEALDAS